MTAMTEELRKKQGGFKLSRNPPNPNDPIVYLGEYLPPDGSFFFTSKPIFTFLMTFSRNWNTRCFMPFDVIFQHAKNEAWCAQEDDFRTFLADFVSCLPQIGFAQSAGTRQASKMQAKAL